jgi:hypothetical protein
VDVGRLLPAGRDRDGPHVRVDRMSRPQRVCAIEGCERPHSARGWCKGHYKRWWTTGDPGPAEFPGRVIQHGTDSMYVNRRCRCEACKEAHRVAHRAYMRSHPEQQERHRLDMRRRYAAKTGVA